MLHEDPHRETIRDGSGDYEAGRVKVKVVGTRRQTNKEGGREGRNEHIILFANII